MTAKRRDYRKEYLTYHKKHLLDNNARHRARYDAEKKGKVHVGDGKDIDHKDKKPKNNSRTNLRVRSISANRADNR